MHRLQTKKGIALVTAVMVISVVLGVTLTLANIITKELQITSSTRNSIFAIYAADAGVECALYWDIRGWEDPPDGVGERVFARSDTETQVADGSGITCLGEDISNPWNDGADFWRTVATTPGDAVTRFEIEFAGDPVYCSRVEITKTVTGPGLASTEIVSRGYNVACADIGTNPSAVERAIRVRYGF